MKEIKFFVIIENAMREYVEVSLFVQEQQPIKIADIIELVLNM